jgi:hypothetical protein
MTVYWRDVRRGQNLVLGDEEGDEKVVGGFRETKRGIDAYAQTFGYDPGRSQKGFATIEDAKAFVESFRPWELHGAKDVTVDREARPALDLESTGKSGPSN